MPLFINYNMHYETWIVGNKLASQQITLYMFIGSATGMYQLVL